MDIRREGIICADILTKWFEYKSDYYRTGNNIMEAHIFENKGILENGSTLESLVFTQVRCREIRERLRRVTLRMVVDGQGRVKLKRDIEGLLEMDISWVEYFRLRTNVQLCANWIRGNGNGGKNISILMSRGKIKSSTLRRRISRG